MSITTEEAERLAKWCGTGLPTIAAALRSLAAERDALQAEIEKLRAVASIPKNTLERFERLVSRMVSEGYAQGYREACNHIMHETIEKLGEKE